MDYRISMKWATKNETIETVAKYKSKNGWVNMEPQSLRRIVDDEYATKPNMNKPHRTIDRTLEHDSNSRHWNRFLKFYLLSSSTKSILFSAREIFFLLFRHLSMWIFMYLCNHTRDIECEYFASLCIFTQIDANALIFAKMQTNIVVTFKTTLTQSKNTFQASLLIVFYFVQEIPLCHALLFWIFNC